MTAVFAKTLKGKDEIDSHAGGLSSVLRRVLIFIDGQRSVKELERLPKIGDLQDVLNTLLRGGYIMPVNELLASDNTITRNSTPLARPLPSSYTMFRPLPSEIDLETLQMARNFMCNTLNAFVGSFGASGLISRIQTAKTHQDLRDLFEEWHSAVIATRAGRKDEKNLRLKLLEII